MVDVHSDTDLLVVLLVVGVGEVYSLQSAMEQLLGRLILTVGFVVEEVVRVDEVCSRISNRGRI